MMQKAKTESVTYCIRDSQLVHFFQLSIEEQQPTFALKKSENFYTWPKIPVDTQSTYLTLSHRYPCHNNLLIWAKYAVRPGEDIVQASDNVHWSLEGTYVPKFKSVITWGAEEGVRITGLK